MKRWKVMTSVMLNTGETVYIPVKVNEDGTLQLGHVFYHLFVAEFEANTNNILKV